MLHEILLEVRGIAHALDNRIDVASVAQVKAASSLDFIDS